MPQPHHLPSLLRREPARTFACVALLCLAGCGSSCNQAKESRPASAAVPELKPELKYGLTAEQAAQVLVRIGDKRITLGEFAERLGSQSPYLRARYNSPERRREFLENMVRFELLAAEAEKRGFEKSEDVERVRKQTMVQQMMQDMFDKGGIKLSDITDATIKQYYESNKSEFDRPAQVRASHILFKDKASAEKVLRELKQGSPDLEVFRKLADAHNIDPSTKDSSGDLRFFSETADPSGETDEPARPASVRKAAFGLARVGDLYPEVVQSELGFHVVKLTGRREAMKRTLDDARRMIQNKLWRKQREDAIDKFVSGLRAQANVQENREALAKVQVRDAGGKTGALDTSAAPKQAGATQQPQAPNKAAEKQ